MSNSRIITFQFLLRDEPGALSAILAAFAQHKTNLMSVNSINPSNGCGVVTIAAETSQTTVSLDEMLHTLQQCPGVIKAEVLAAG
jgi:chorismate mutase